MNKVPEMMNPMKTDRNCLKSLDYISGQVTRVTSKVYYVL